MKRCHITDRRLAGGIPRLLDIIERSDAEGIDLIQIREKDLPTRDLCRLVESALSVCRRARILVNSRIDVALSCGAHGAHLPDDSVAPSEWRRIVPPGFLLGVSCHDLGEVIAAEKEGADYILFAPVFRPLSKDDARTPHGLDGLRRACRAVTTPVYALGGITAENASSCEEAGAAGIAGITLFQK